MNSSASSLEMGRIYSPSIARGMADNSSLEAFSEGAEVVESPSESNFYETDVLGSFFLLAKSTVAAMRKHPLKALTLFLALQNNSSSMQMPCADAFVTNLNRNFTYEVNGLPVSVFPNITFMTAFRCNASIALSDINAGNLSSTGLRLPQSFVAGVWKAEGSAPDLVNTIKNLYFRPAKDYAQRVELYTTIYDQFNFEQIQGTMQIHPVASTATSIVNTPVPTPKITTIDTLPARSMTSTSKETQSGSGASPATVAATTQASALTQAVSDSSTMVVGTSDQNETDSIARESVVTALTTSKLVEGTTAGGSERSTDSLVTPDKQPPYGIIGGVVGGAALSCGLILAAVVYKRGLMNRAQKSTLSGVHNQELGIQPAVPVLAQQQQLSNGQYMNLPLAQNRPPVAYDVALPAVNGEYDFISQSMLKNEYDSPQSPLA